MVEGGRKWYALPQLQQQVLCCSSKQQVSRAMDKMSGGGTRRATSYELSLLKRAGLVASRAPQVLLLSKAMAEKLAHKLGLPKVWPWAVVTTL